MKIKSIKARQILDSRGYPTVECDVVLEDGSFGRAAVPSGASTGSHEALELRDGDASYYRGKSVQKAVAAVNDRIAAAVTGMDAGEQRAVDMAMQQLDGTGDKSSLGANAILATSLAVAHAAAASQHILLYRHIQALSNTPEVGMPIPMVNIINGGRHASGSTDIQEFMIMPQGTTMAARIEQASNVFHALGDVLKDRGLATLVGDEGGYAPHIQGNEAALECIVEAVVRAGYEPGKDIQLALDVAASELYADGSYHLGTEARQLTTDQMISWYAQLSQSYPIVSIEDGLDENDWAGWVHQTAWLGEKLTLVGDDLLVTNTEFLRRAIDEKACNAILIKPNQIGTLSETLDAIVLARDAGFRAIVSHRSGETEDTTIAHIVVGCNTGYIKTGSMSRGERTAKYNELLRIEESLRA
jgi:enolase